MTVRALSADRPVVALFCGPPIARAALVGALRRVADVREFPPGDDDLAGLLAGLAPDAVIVDADSDARIAESYARAASVPLLHLAIQDQRLRVLVGGRWEGMDTTSPELIRNTLLASWHGVKRRQRAGVLSGPEVVLEANPVSNG